MRFVHQGGWLILLLSMVLLMTVAGCSDGSDGRDGINGRDGENGVDGTDGAAGADGQDGADAGQLLTRPRSSMIAVSLQTPLTFDAGFDAQKATLPFSPPDNIPEFVDRLIEAHWNAELPDDYQFPLSNAAADDVRALEGLNHNVVVSWLDPLTWDDSDTGARFGANCDYVAYFGDGWDTLAGSPPQWNGNGTSGWVWSNHEYVSNKLPTTTQAPEGQALTLALWLRERGILTNDVTSNEWDQADVDTFIRWHKRQLGGSWLHIVKDPATGKWFVDRSAPALRYDAASSTQLALIGAALNRADTDDEGNALPSLSAGAVVAGIAGDCSGGQSPWGTIFSAEENVQDYYGDLEACWPSSSNNFDTSGDGAGFAPGQVIAPPYASSTADPEAAFGRISNAAERHERDVNGWLAELDPGVSPDEYYTKNPGPQGHRKIGPMGRARWENCTFVTDENWKLLDGKRIVIYGANDRRGGRIYKFVSRNPYSVEMTREQTRNLLNEGTLYVSEWRGPNNVLDNANGWDILDAATLNNLGRPTEQVRGEGRWIEVNVLNTTDVAPNAAALGAGTTVSSALANVDWNGIGGFGADQNLLMTNLFTACMKLGVMELNRPEDVEWNPKDPHGNPLLYVAFTYHARTPGLRQDGTLDVDDENPTREGGTGAIYAIEEADPASPEGSMTFTYWLTWEGSTGTGPFDAARPDNLMIDANGGLWFGTDGNFSQNKTADALYFIDLDPERSVGTISGRQRGEPGGPTYGLAFRVCAGPSDSEATGPCLSSDMRTIFFNAQHPGESRFSSWPSFPTAR